MLLIGFTERRSAIGRIDSSRWVSASVFERPSKMKISFLPSLLSQSFLFVALFARIVKGEPRKSSTWEESLSCDKQTNCSQRRSIRSTGWDERINWSMIRSWFCTPLTWTWSNLCEISMTSRARVIREFIIAQSHRRFKHQRERMTIKKKFTLAFVYSPLLSSLLSSSLDSSYDGNLARCALQLQRLIVHNFPIFPGDRDFR